MRRAFPARKITIPYHGMTLPFPMTSSLYAPLSSKTSENTTDGSLPQTHCSTSSETCSVDAENVEISAAKGIVGSPAAGSSVEMSVTNSGCSSLPLQPRETSGLWGQVGRGRRRVLQQFVSSHTSSPPTDRQHDTHTTNVGATHGATHESSVNQERVGSDEATENGSGNDCDTENEEPCAPDSRFGDGGGKEIGLTENPVVAELTSDTSVERGSPDGVQPLQLPSPDEKQVTRCPPTPQTPRTPRKSRISLAIQFKGVCTHSPQEDRVTPHKTTAVNSPLMRPSDFTQPKPSSSERVSAGQSPTGCVSTHVGGGVQRVRDSECEAVVTQVCEGDMTVCGGEGELLLSEPLVSDSGDGEEWELCASGDSSEDDEGRCEGVRMGFSSAQLKKSISVHIKNIHRNKVEVKRVKRRIRGTEEVLAADLADQCAQEDEDTFKYTITPDRENEVARVLDLQLQLATLSLEKSSLTDQMESDAATMIAHDKLMKKELKVACEAAKVERELEQAMKAAQFMQAKTETAMS